MRLHYLFLGLCFSGVVLTSCSSEDDSFENEVAGPEKQEKPLLRAAVFPEDDGAKALSGTPARNVMNLLIKAGPDFARQKGTYSITEEQYAEIKAFTDSIVAECTKEKDVYKTIFKWVSENIRYVYTDNEPYAVFKTRQGICQGYANLLNVMLDTQGIPVTNVNGLLNPYGGHAWNYVYVDEKWKVSDPTNNAEFTMTNVGTYQNLVPFSIDEDLCEDDNYVYNFTDTHLNLKKVKTSDDVLVVPFSVLGFQITSFNPTEKLPSNVREICLGKNIKTLGESIMGLNLYAPNVETVHLDPENTSFDEYGGALYYKNTYSLCYIPAAKTIVEFPPVEVMGKNFVAGHKGMEEIIITPGTKTLEAYAFENCPSLRVAYVPEDTQVDERAFYNVHSNFQIIRGDYTGIEEIRM